MTLHDTKIISLNLNTGELAETKIPRKVLDPDKVGVKTSEISKEVLEEKNIAISFSKMTDGRAYSLAAKIKEIADKIDALLVVGAPNSSNSKRLVEVGKKAGCEYSQLVQRATEIDFRALEGIESLGITAGASAPEILINEVVESFKEKYLVRLETVETAVENINFKVPRVLREKV